MGKKEYITGIVTGVVLSAAGFALAFFLFFHNNTGNHVMSDPARMSRLEALEDLIDQYYLGEKDEEKLAQGVYHGLIYGLGDPYSRYYTPEEYVEESSVSDGSYDGIGVLIYPDKDGYPIVSKVYEGLYSDKAGVKAGDRILSIDGQDAAEMGSLSLIAYIQNGEHDSVTMDLERNGEENLTVTVEVGPVILPSVEYEMLEGSVGYIRIKEFKGVTTEQFKEAFEDLSAQQMQKLIIDLRDNPGGYVNAVCDILRTILPEGLIVYTEDKHGNRLEETCEGETPLAIPLAVLVNKSSASASEIFAGAVQDHGTGLIVGEKTYGKGIVQSIRTFSDGSAVKLTTSQYYTPDGHYIHEVGIAPDIEVTEEEQKNASEEDVYIEKALQALGE